MSWRLTETASAIADLPDEQSRVLVRLAKYASDDGTGARPGVERLALETGKSARTIQRILRALEQRGLIAPVAYALGGRKHATEYRVMLDTDTVSPMSPIRSQMGDTAGEQRVPAMAAKGVTQRKKRVTPVAAKGVTPVTPIDQEQIKRIDQEQITPRPSAGPPVPVPEPLLLFDQALRQAPGYAPTSAFYENVLAKWGDLDLEVEALGIVDWLTLPKQKREKRTASPGFVYNWLKRSAERRPAYRQNGYSNGHAKPNGKYQSPLSRTQATLAELQAGGHSANTWTDARVAADPEAAIRDGLPAEGVALIVKQQTEKRAREAQHV